MSATVLLVDDDPDILENEAYILHTAGYRVLTADSFSAAVKCIGEIRPDLAVIDIGLPDGDGVELGWLLRGAGIPFIIVSATSLRIDVERSLTAGARDYLLKPVPATELIERVGVVVGACPPVAPQV